MKLISRFVVVFLVIAAVSSCKKKPNGQLTGVLDRPKFKGINPYGMVYIPSGTLTIGPSDQDMNFAKIQRSKSISINGFFMDDTEISNNEYRQFVNYVRDSIAHTKLSHFLTDENGGQQRIDWSQEIDWSGGGEGETVRRAGQAGVAGPGREAPDRLERADDRRSRTRRGGAG